MRAAGAGPRNAKVRAATTARTEIPQQLRLVQGRNSHVPGPMEARGLVGNKRPFPNRHMYREHPVLDLSMPSSVTVPSAEPASAAMSRRQGRAETVACAAGLRLRKGTHSVTVEVRIFSIRMNL